MAAAAMQEYLSSRWESAPILFILPGEREVYDVRNALSTWEFDFDWEPYILVGETPDHEVREVLGRLRRQRFDYRCSAVFVLATAGVSEDGWTIWVNSVVDSGLQMHVDDLGFVHCGPEDSVSGTQRKGRGGWVGDAVFCRLSEEVAALR